MNLNKFTLKAQEAVQAALELASEQKQQALEPTHMLKALVTDSDNVVLTILNKIGVSVSQLSSSSSSGLPGSSMASALTAGGRDFELRYCGRSEASMAYRDKLAALCGDRLRLPACWRATPNGAGTPRARSSAPTSSTSRARSCSTSTSARPSATSG